MDKRKNTIERVARIVDALQRSGQVSGLNRQEAVAEGLLGLAESDTRYDQTQGANRWTFAKRRIAGAVIDASRREVKSRSAIPPTAGAGRVRMAAGVGCTLVWPAKPELGDLTMPLNADRESRTFESRLTAREMSMLLGKALRALPARRRHMVLECGLKGRSARAAGDEIGLSRGRAIRFLQKGLDQIRDALEGKGYCLEDFL